MSDEHATRTAIVMACRAMNQTGLTRGASGNISVRFGDGLLISPTGVPYADVTPEMTVPMRWDGSFGGDVLPSSEWRFHRDILQRRPELNAVVHNHSPHATAVSVMEMAIPAIHYSIAAVGGPDIPCATYATFGSPELAENALAVLQDRKACLLAHHGVIATGTSLPQAMNLAEIVEEMARLYILSCAIGTPLLLPAVEIENVRQKLATHGQRSRAAA